LKTFQFVGAGQIYEERTEKLMGATWTLPIIHPIAIERLDYPTQKPESIFERLIKISVELTAAPQFGQRGAFAPALMTICISWRHCRENSAIYQPSLAQLCPTWRIVFSIVL
jgi:hypothetical protein